MVNKPSLRECFAHETDLHTELSTEDGDEESDHTLTERGLRTKVSNIQLIREFLSHNPCHLPAHTRHAPSTEGRSLNLEPTRWKVERPIRKSKNERTEPHILARIIHDGS